MLRKFSAALALASFLILGACSNGGGSPGNSNDNFRLVNADNGKPLTSAQKNIFTNLVGSLELIDKAGRAADSGSNVGVPAGDQMKQSLRDSNCNIEAISEKKDNSNRSDKFNISGDLCPIAQTSVSTFSHQIGIQANSNMKASYVVRDLNYKSLNDVSEIAFQENFNGNYSITNNGASFTGSGKGQGFVKSSLRGEIQITSESAADYQLMRSGNTGGFESILVIDFKDFVVVLRERQVYAGSIQKTYFLNGSTISYENYLRYTRYFTLTEAERGALLGL